MASTSPLGIDLERYKWGFHDSQDKYVFKARKGLDADVVNQISHMKGEPDWMRAFRLHAYEHFTRRPLPTRGAAPGPVVPPEDNKLAALSWKKASGRSGVCRRTVRIWRETCC